MFRGIIIVESTKFSVLVRKVRSVNKFCDIDGEGSSCTGLRRCCSMWPIGGPEGGGRMLLYKWYP